MMFTTRILMMIMPGKITKYWWTTAIGLTFTIGARIAPASIPLNVFASAFL